MKNLTVLYIKIKLINHANADDSLNTELVNNCMNEIIHNIFEFDKRSVSIEDPNTQTETIFTFLSHHNAISLIEILSKYGILLEYVDITEAVLMNSISNKSFADMFYSELFHRIEHKQMLELFIKENLTIDIVLDKISKYGMSTLSETDLKVLTNTV